MSAGVLVAHVIAAVAQAGPVAVPDVPGYLSVAQWIAGGQPPPPFGYHPGYGIMLAPVALAGASPDALHTAALVLNGLFAATGVVLAAAVLWALAPQSKPLARVAVVGIAALHPSLSVAARVAWPETALVVVVLATTLLVAHAARRPTWPVMLAVGACSAAGVVLHPRAIALVVAATVAVVVIRPRWRGRVGFVSGVALVAGVTALALAWAYTGPPGTDRLSGAFGPADQGAGLATLVAGQLVALSAGTLGLAMLGLVGCGAAVVDAIQRRRPTWSGPAPMPAVGVLLVTAVAITALVSGASLAGSDRADTLAYGRYLDPYAIVLATVAVASGVLRRTRAVAVAAGLVLAAAAIVWNATATVQRPGLRIMTLANDPWWILGDGRIGPALAAMAAVSGLGLGLAWLAAARGRRVPRPAPVVAVVAVLALLGTATVTGQRHVAAVGTVAAGQYTAAAVVHAERERADRERVDPTARPVPGCLAHDRADVPSYAMWLYRLALPDLEHRRVDLAGGQVPCSPLVIASIRDGRAPECAVAELLHDEPRARWGLWRVDPTTCAAGSPRPAERPRR